MSGSRVHVTGGGIHGRGEIALLDVGRMPRFRRTDGRSTGFVKRSPGIRADGIVHVEERAIRPTGRDPVACDMAVVDGAGPETPGHQHHRLPNGIPFIDRPADLDEPSRRRLPVAPPRGIEDGVGLADPPARLPRGPEARAPRPAGRAPASGPFPGAFP